MKRRRYVVLDRDGTLIVERHYLSHPDQVELLPGVETGLRRLIELGLGLVILTNQSGVGRKFFDERDLCRIHERLLAILEAKGIHIDGIYYCPHLPEDSCDCRKPNPGMLRLAGDDLGFEPSTSFVVGDKPCDIELGKTVGATTLLVRTGYGATFAVDPSIDANYIVDNLADAAIVIEKALFNGPTSAFLQKEHSES